MKLHAKLTALSLTAALLLTGCGTSITGITLGVPQTMERGSTGVATPEYVYSGATPEQARAEELADKLGLAWSSSDPAVVMVDADGNLAAVGTGTAEVALSSEDGKLSANGVIKVVVSPTGLTLPETLTLTEGGDGQSLAATVEPADATDYTITYASSDESVAAVDAAGNVTPVAAGEADVTAEIAGNGLTSSCHVVVTPAVEALYLSEDAVTLGTADDVTLTLYAEPEEVDVSAAVWTSSDESVATVDEEGTVTAVAEGEATVTANLGGMEAICEVTVSDKTSAGSSSSGSDSSGASADSSAPVSTDYGAIPFNLAAGTMEWWHIDSTDDAYWATLNNINAYRAAVGVAPLSIDAGLSQIAYTRTLDMVRSGVMSHDGYQTPEIIAQNYNSAQSVVDAWAASPGHYAAMTDPSYTICGIACEFEEGGATYWCVTFG
ncbi:Ig-like domain-containing protein [Gemmiger formicilis]|uniref:Ig-like domain-containing protein n=1 Tax=Gemmiger formicilis TaxID=745368 RepID=UPI00195CAB16|nr:Ig-like domain-containing protein [Gemmiger formicilis]MBM6900785.1 Ig-like domain-containing protein [Gemmiger formicilis]